MIRRNLLAVGFFLSIIAVLFVGCTADREADNSESIYSEILPAIDELSGTEYESFEHHFSPVSKAVYWCNGEETEITADDPRLIQLLNFIAYAYESGDLACRQGYVEEDEIQKCLSIAEPMLEVHFDIDGASDGYLIEDTPKIVICGHQLLAILPEENNVPLEGLLAEEWYPYYESAVSLVDQEILSEDVLVQNEWGEEGWLNLLTCAGF